MTGAESPLPKPVRSHVPRQYHPRRGGRTLRQDRRRTATTCSSTCPDEYPTPASSTRARPSSPPRPCGSPATAATWINLIADRLLSVTLDGAPLADAHLDEHRLRFQAPPAEHELTISALCRYSRTGEGLHRFVDPVDDLVYCYTQFETADARRMYACFEQPDLKATFALTVIAPAAVDGAVELAGGRADPRERRPRPLGVRADAADLHLRHRAGRRRLPHRARQLMQGLNAEIPCRCRVASRWCPTSTPTGSSPPPRPASPCSRSTSALAVPVRRLRPDLRAGVQRRCDGERRLRDHPRRVPVPLAGHQRRLRGPRQHDPARARAHVVRRPGHDDLVGRPVAQRIASPNGRSHFCQAEIRAPGHRRGRPVGDLRQQPQDLGVPAGPARLHPPVAADMVDLAARRAELRRHHLRQGCLGDPPAGRLRRPGRVPRRRARLLRRARLGQHPADATCWPRSPRRRDATCRTSPPSGCRPPGSTPSTPSSPPTTPAPSPASRSGRSPSPEWPTLRHHRLAIGLYDEQDGRLRASTGPRSTSPAI